jgi:ammonium transporter Rh
MATSSNDGHLNELAAQWLTQIVDPEKIKKQHEDQTSWNSMKALNESTWFIGIFQLFLVILFGTCVRDTVLPTGVDAVASYNMFIGVEIMMFVGFGYLMTFMKLYGLGAVGFCMLITATALQFYPFVESFWSQLYDNNEWHNVDINITTLLTALYAVSSVLISFGALIGKVSPIQLLVMTVLELIAYGLNYKILLSQILKVTDVGGTYADHMFGAYFGLTVAYILGKPVHVPDMGNLQDLFALVGTLFLWIYWPSFVAGAEDPNSPNQQRAIVNTILALAASTLAAFWGSSFFSVDARLRPVDIQNATLAGGVAIGATANCYVQPFAAIMIGLAAGFTSIVGYNILMPRLENLGLHDTCGIHNLHGLPSIVGAIASVIIAAYSQKNNETTPFYSADKNRQWEHQLLGIFLCLGFSIVSGAVTGFILKYIGAMDMDKISDTDVPFQDNCYWEVAEDYGRTFYKELAAIVQNDPNHAIESAKLRGIMKKLEDLSGHGGRVANTHNAFDVEHGHDNVRHPVIQGILDLSNHKTGDGHKPVASKDAQEALAGNGM